MSGERAFVVTALRDGRADAAWALAGARAALATQPAAVCFLLGTPQSALPLVRVVQTLVREFPQVAFELADDGALTKVPKLLAAFRQAGLAAHLTPADLSGPLAAIAQGLPPDYLTLQSAQNGTEAVLRLTTRCNAQCHFCWLCENAREPTPALNYLALQQLQREAIGQLTFSGGEPTLLPDLTDYIRWGKEHGFSQLTLQTNGFRLGDAGRVAALSEAGLDLLFLALHGHTAAISAAVNGTTDGHARAWKALDTILASPLFLIVNHVLATPNVEHLPAFVAALLARVRAASRPILLNVAMAMPLGHYRAQFTHYTPRVAALRAALDAAWPILAANSDLIQVTGLATPCGPPLCAFRAIGEEALRAALSPTPPPPDFTKPAACAACRLGEHCPGLREIYAATFGTDEVLPF